MSKNKGISDEVAFKIGGMLALLHNKQYIHTALLNKNLSIEKTITPFEKQYELFLDGLSGRHLSENLKRDLHNFIDDNSNLIEQICESNVFCHGDFNPSNILIDEIDTPWFIVFEYSFSAPSYYDIGKLLRTRENYSQYLGEKVRNNFANGYKVNGV